MSTGTSSSVYPTQDYPNSQTALWDTQLGFILTTQTELLRALQDIWRHMVNKKDPQRRLTQKLPQNVSPNYPRILKLGSKKRQGIHLYALNVLRSSITQRDWVNMLIRKST
jgi:hypothetical protein